ncbi:hypothetical protein [uncultured Aquimarina sp.]|uniref:hypothetical protein n=1 Tax=uncultured Aquimarina sp. TaxID=575652 RepID=UPI00263423CE|nr:hypothetical protein [uncultured Aquimarina sp.]
MRLNDQMYLIIDSNYGGYQPIHVGLNRSFIIACKFKFHSDTSFEITHSKLIIARKEKENNEEPNYDEYSINMVHPTEIENNTKEPYSRKIKIDIPDEPTRNPNVDNDEFYKIQQSNLSSCEKKSGNYPTRNHIIDIENPDEKIKILLPFLDFGNHICRSYII